MKLTYRIVLRIALVLLPVMVLWSALFYFAMVNEINDEADDSLEDYSARIIVKVLAGQSLPQTNDGSNNSYTIQMVDKEYADSHPHIFYYDSAIYIQEKGETEPARILTTIFSDKEGNYYQLLVSTPTFEKIDLIGSILRWIVVLYFMLLITVLILVTIVIRRSMSPLYSILRWLDTYTPGHKIAPIIVEDTNITEFKKLKTALNQAIERSESLFEEQKLFIGNASHELQTPLAVIGNRIDMLLDSDSLSEEQMGELFKMRYTLDHIVRLNKSLLLLTKIDNGQFPENSPIDIIQMLHSQTATLEDIYASRSISCKWTGSEALVVTMNESLAGVLVNNLIKNAFVHSENGGTISISSQKGMLAISNPGETALDENKIFERFYQGSKREGSTGLGLALVYAVCRYYSFPLEYHFHNHTHTFTIKFY